MNKTAVLLLWPALSLCINAQITLGPNVATFGVLAGSTVTNSGSTVVNGNLGVSPGAAITGFPPGTINGTVNSANALAATAQNELTTAYNAAAGAACSTVLTGQDLGGLTLTPGVYCFATSAQLTGTLTLNALGNPNAQFVFQIGSTLTTASSSVVLPINGAQASNIFWQVGTSATLGTSTVFFGDILALASISLNTSATIVGSALARNGAVTLLSNGITAAGPPFASATPAPSSLILITTALIGLGIYQARDRLLRPFRSR